MIRSVLTVLLALIAFPATADGYLDLSKAPTDARSYCARLNALPSIQSYASQYTTAASHFLSLPPSGSTYEQAKVQVARLHSLALDDSSRSLAKKVLERINRAVPKTDAYNQDVAFLPYAAWFASCASSLGSDDPLIVVFLSPLTSDVADFFNTPVADREQKLVQLMGNPGLGGLEAQSIADQTALDFAGINPRCVLPLAIAMTGADSWIEVQASVVLPEIEQFSVKVKNAVAFAGSIEDGSHPGCQRIESSRAVKDYVAAVLKVQHSKISSSQIQGMIDQAFSDPDGRLISTITSRLQKLSTLDGKFDQLRHEEAVWQFNTIIENCAKKHLNDDLFLFFSKAAADSEAVKTQREHFSRLGAVALNYDGKRPSGGTNFELTPQWASLYAFIFDDGDDLIGKEAEQKAQEILARLNAVLEERQEQIVKNEQEKYAGLKALQKLSLHPALRASFEKCKRREKVFQSKITSQIGAEAKNADIAAEQKLLLENVKYRNSNIDALTHGMCLYRMNFALNYLEINNEVVALSSGYQASRVNSSDLSAKYTENALGKVANQLEQQAEKFHQRIDDVIRKASKEVNQQRAVTRRQQEQLFANRLSINMFGNIIYSGIFEWLVEPVAEGKHLQP